MKTVAVLFGSRSAEHDISIITALTSVIKPLEASKKYRVEAVYIDKNGQWYWDDRLKDISLYQTGDIDDFCLKAPQVQLQFGDGLTLIKSSQFAGRKKYQKIDLVFPATHGTFGEDGSLMGLLEMAGVPYVGCGLEASTIAMNKLTSKIIAQHNDLPTPNYVYLTAREFAEKGSDMVEEIDGQLTYPLFIKPCRLGSSIGVSKVESSRELTNAIEVAMHYDDKIIIEEAVHNLVEVTIPLMGNNDGSLEYGAVEQPLAKDDGVFDFDTKYMHQNKGGKLASSKVGSQGYSQIPADVTDDISDEVKRVAGAIYRSVGCEGIARIDLLIDTKRSIVYFNEINPMPGSLYRHNWASVGISSVELVEKLVHLAILRHERARTLTTTFSTNFLKQF